MAQRWTGYTSGTEGLRQSVESNKSRQSQMDILSAQLTAQKDIADERNKLTKQQMDFSNAEKIRRDAFESQTLKYRDDEKIRLDERNKAKDLRDASTSQATLEFRTATLNNQIKVLKSRAFEFYGFDNTDESGESLPNTVKGEKGKLIPNPVLVERGAQFDGTRLVSVRESVMDAQAKVRIEETMGVIKQTKELEKINKANQTPVDALLFDPDESRWGGFNEESALNNLKKQSAQWADVVDLMSVLPANNAKRKFLLNSMIELRGELRGDKYASATASYAIDSKRYGKLRGGLASSLDSYIDRLK